MKLRSKISTFALLCVALGSQALTLGPVQGTAVLGQALDVLVQVQMDAGEDPALCFEAEVFHADARQDGGKVRTVVEKQAQGRTATVRIVSASLVDEPVVAINLRSTCGPKLSRRFVLFADLPEGALASPLPVAAAPTPAPATSGPVKPAVKTTAPARLPRAKPKLSLASEPVAVLPVEPKSAATKRSVAPAPKAETTGKLPSGRVVGAARLKLDPLDVLSDRIANLDSFMSFAPSEDALANIQKVKTLEAEVKALRDSALKNERALAEFRSRLQQAEAQRSSGELVYLLAGVVVCCLLAAFWLWRRQRHGLAGAQNWWSDGVTGQPPEADRLAPAPVVAPVSHSERQSLEHGLAYGMEAQAVDLTDSMFSKLMQPDAMGQSTSKAASLQPHAKLARSLNSDEILALRAKAQDCVVAGKPERAAALLKQQISEGDEPNPFVYLDLLTLFHAMNLQTDFQQCAQDFNLLFNGKVPEFAFFKDEGKSLESYPEVLARITEHWPTLKVLEVIEACVFRDPWAGSSEPFDLAAMHDLMMLHGVAQSLVLAEIPQGEAAASAHSAVAEARPSQHAGLDFDYADSVASSFPALSKSALADLFGHPVEPHATVDIDLDLDLNLSDLDGPGPSATVAPPTQAGLQLKNSGY